MSAVFARYEQVLALEHYLDVLLRKPGALAGSLPLQQCREHGHWPESFDQLWQSLQRREGKQAGTRSMIELLQQGSQHGWEKLKQAVSKPGYRCRMRQRYGTFWSLENGARCSGAPGCGRLERYERPLPVMSNYDLLLDEVAEVAR